MRAVPPHTKTHMTAEGSKIDFTTFRKVAVQKRASRPSACMFGRASALVPPPGADENADTLTTQQILDRVSSASRDDVELVESSRRGSKAPAAINALNADDEDDGDEQKQQQDGADGESPTVQNPVRS